MQTVTTFDLKSDLLTQFDGDGESRLAKPRDLGGRVRIAKFSKTFAADAAGSTCELVRLSGATIIGGRLDSANLGSGTSIDIGTDDGTTATADNLLDGLATTSVKKTLFGGLGTAAPIVDVISPFTLYATVLGGAATGEISGYVLYVENS